MLRKKYNMNKLILLFIGLMICSCASHYIFDDRVYVEGSGRIKHVHLHGDDREYQCEELYGRRADFSSYDKGCITYYNEEICLDEGGKWIAGFFGDGRCIMPLKKDEHE